MGIASLILPANVRILSQTLHTKILSKSRHGRAICISVDDVLIINLEAHLGRALLPPPLVGRRPLRAG